MQLKDLLEYEHPQQNILNIDIAHTSLVELKALLKLSKSKKEREEIRKYIKARDSFETAERIKNKVESVATKYGII